MHLKDSDVLWVNYNYMPKQPANITKAKRIQTILEVIERWGRLQKAQIDEHVAQSLGIDVNDIKKSTYLDLTDLVVDHSIIEYRYSPDGALLEEYDPVKHKNTRCEYESRKRGSQISGAALLESKGAKVLVSERLRRSVQVTNIVSGVDLIYFNMLFELEDMFFNLRVKLDDLPFTLILTRIKEGEKVTINDFEAVFKKRSIVLSLPIPNLSSYSEKSRFGHSSLTVVSPDDIQVSDLGSRNGTAVLKLITEEAEILIKKGSLIGDVTTTEVWSSIKAGKAAPIEIKLNELRSFAAPLVIQASNAFRLLIN